MSAKLKEFGKVKSFEEILAFFSTNFKNLNVSLSGYGDVLCFSCKNLISILNLNSKSNNDSSGNFEFLPVFQEEIVPIDKAVITSISVVPIGSQKQSSYGMPDWTCVCVGLNNGEVRFLDQYGQLIYCQTFVPDETIERIIVWSSEGGIKSEQYSSNSHEIISQFHEYLFVIYPKCAIQVEGKYLYDSLNMLKKQLARTQAGIGHFNLGFNQQTNYPNNNNSPESSFILSFKKFNLDTHEHVADAAFSNLGTNNILDSIYHHSTLKGPYAAPNDAANQFINCAIVGKQPFVTFYQLPLDTENMDMGDLAHAVYNKVKGALYNSVSSWFVGGGTAQSSITVSNTGPQSAPTIEAGKLSQIYTVNDTSRRATRVICSSPQLPRTMAAMTDDFGRIFLLDINDGAIVRIWKGYRDAQVSILTTSGECSSATYQSSSTSPASSSATSIGSSRRYVNYLVIYAPRRSLLEIWTLPFGERVASFDVQDHDGRLLHIPHSVLGTVKCMIGNMRVRDSYCTFFLDSTGKLYHIDVPFHLSLAATSSKRSQDNLILKHFKAYIKANKITVEYESIKEEFISYIMRLKLTSSAEYLLHYFMNLPFVSADNFRQLCIQVIQIIQDNKLCGASSDFDRQNLRENWTNKILLLDLYIELQSINNNVSTISAVVGDETCEQIQSQEGTEDVFQMESNDFQRIVKLMGFYQKQHRTQSKPGVSDSVIQKHPPSFQMFVGSFQKLSVSTSAGPQDQDTMQNQPPSQPINDLDDTSNSSMMMVSCVRKQFQLTSNLSDHDLVCIGSFIFGNTISMYNTCHSNKSPVELLANSQFCLTAQSSFKLLIHLLLDNANQYDVWSNCATLKGLLKQLFHLYDWHGSNYKTPNDATNASATDLLSIVLLEMSNQLDKSHNLMSGLIVAMLIRVQLLEMLQYIDQIEQTSSGGNNEEDNQQINILQQREFLEDQLSKWDDNCQRLEDLCLFSSLLNCCPLKHNQETSTHKYQLDANLTLAFAVDKGRVIFSERFAKWSVKWNLDYQHITQLYKSLGNTKAIYTNSLSLDVEDDSNSSANLINDEIIEIFSYLYKQLPHSLEYEYVLINVAWEYTTIWSKSIHKVKYLSFAWVLMSNIGPLGGSVVQGVGSMMWDLHLCSGLSQMFPATHISTSPISVSSSVISEHKSRSSMTSAVCVEIISAIIKLLQIIVKCQDSIDVVPTFNSDRVWRLDKHRTSLLEMSSTKPPVNLLLVDLQCAILTVLRLMNLVSMDQFKYQMLYSREFRKLLFTPLSKSSNDSSSMILTFESIQSENRDAKPQRIRFIESIIQLAVEKMSTEPTFQSQLSTLVTADVDWLVNNWQLDIYHVRNHWVETLYKYGLDSMVGPYLDKIQDYSQISLRLLPIIGARIKKDYLLSGSKYQREFSKYLTKRLNLWMSQLDSELLRLVKPMPLDQTSILLEQILEWLSEEHQDYEIATCLHSLILNITRTLQYVP